MRLAGCRVAVIGAGIGGLAAARALAARRAEVCVFEQARALGEVGAGIQVAPNGVAVLEALGLRDAAEECASLPKSVEMAGMDGRPIATVPLGPECVARYGRPYWQFHRADLLALLADGIRAAGISLELGARVTSVDLDGGRVVVAGAAGPLGRFDLVVAADGVRSMVRETLTGGPAPRFTGHVAWRGLVEAARLPEELRSEKTRVSMGPGRHLVTYPLHGGSVINFVAVERRAAWAEESWTAADDPENLRRAFSGWGGPDAVLLDAVDRTFLWGLFDHPPLATWRRGPVALLGDACHPMLPFLAQGATMALEDAWVLAAEVDTAASIEEGLCAYEARRLPRTARVQRAAARNGRFYHLGGIAGSIAHLGLRAMSLLAPGGLIGSFDWLYGADIVSARATQ